MKTDDKTLIEALRILSRDIQSDDGVANACIAEAANRLAELTREDTVLVPRELLGNWIRKLDEIKNYELKIFYTPSDVCYPLRVCAYDENNECVMQECGHRIEDILKVLRDKGFSSLNKEAK